MGQATDRSVWRKPLVEKWVEVFVRPGTLVRTGLTGSLGPDKFPNALMFVLRGAK